MNARKPLFVPREAVADLIAAAQEVAEEHLGILDATRYAHEDDEIGERICCGVLSYQPHALGCPAVRLRLALSRCKV